MKPRVLIIEDNQANMDLARYLLEAHGFECDEASDGAAGLARLRANRPDLVICDLQLPGMDGFAVLRELRADTLLRDLPVVAVTAYAMVGDRDRVLAAGFDGYLAKPLDPQRFVAQIQAFLPAQPAEGKPAALVLVVDDRSANSELLETVLGYYGHRVEHARDGAEALERIAARRPDLVITDLLMPNVDGEELCRRLRADPALAALPIIIHTASYRSRQARQIAERVGVRWVLPKPCEPSEVGAMVAEALGIERAESAAAAGVPAAREKKPLPDHGGLAVLHQRNARLAELLSDAMAIAEIQKAALDSRLARDPEALALRLDGVVNLALRMSSEREPRMLMERFCEAVQDLLSARYVGVTIFSEGADAASFVARGLDAAAAAQVATGIGASQGSGRMLEQPGSLRMIVASGPGDFTGLPAAHPPVRNMLACAVVTREATAGWVYAADRLGDEGFSAEDERLLAALAATLGTFWGTLMTQHELDRRVAERTRELAAANAELQMFSAVVSHDLRAPLGNIDGYAKALHEKFGDQLPPAALRYLDKITANARTMSTLIEDMLRFARTAHQPLDLREVELAPLVRECVEALRDEIEQRAITVLDGPLPSCRADPVLIKQVFTNLLGNAVKYTREQPHPIIEIESRIVGREHLFIVRDNGVGFDPAHAHKLFTAFNRLHSSSQFEGSGIGLATVKQIVDRHGGRLWAQAQVGQGACFTFTLPV